MGLLSTEMVETVLEALRSAEVPAEALLEPLPPAIRSAIPRGGTAAEALYLLVHRLNQWEASGDQPPPLRAVLSAACYFSAARSEESVLRRALAALEEQVHRRPADGRVEGRPAPSTALAIWIRRARQFFTSCGYHIEPSATGCPATFVADRMTGIVSVVGVAIADVGATIRAVLAECEALANSGVGLEGCVVVTTTREAELVDHHARIHAAGLRPLTTQDICLLDERHIEAVARRFLARLVQDADESGPGSRSVDVQSMLQEAGMDGELCQLLQSSTSRLLLIQGDALAVGLLPNLIGRVCASRFLANEGVPTPLPIRLQGTPPYRLHDSVRGVFEQHGLHYRPSALRSLLDEGVLLPVVFWDGAAADIGHPLTLVSELLGSRARAVLVIGTDRAIEVSALKEGLGLSSAAVRVVDAPAVSRRAHRARSVPLAALIAYAPSDLVLRDEFMKHLAALRSDGLVDAWHDGRIEPGSDRASEIQRRIAAADLILLLVSADLIASGLGEAALIEAVLAGAPTGLARVIPILVRPCDTGSGRLRGLQSLPANGKPVTTWADRDEAWVAVARGVRAAAEGLLRSAKAPHRG